MARNQAPLLSVEDASEDEVFMGVLVNMKSW
jgi:hypothetical protein